MWVRPEQYLYTNRHEGQLAGEVWEIAEKNWKRGGYEFTFPHNFLAMSPAFLFIPPMRRILYARDFITTERTYGDVNAFTKDKYNLGEIANVEHFYTAALLALIGGMHFAALGSTLWDGIISPSIKVWRHRHHTWKAMAKGVFSDMQQLTVYDMQGAFFGCACNPATMGNPDEALIAGADLLGLKVGNAALRAIQK